MARTWTCKIGEVDRLPRGADNFMRQAVEDAYKRLTGSSPNFTFSGWGDALTVGERAAADDVDPDPDDVIAEVDAEIERLIAVRASALLHLTVGVARYHPPRVKCGDRFIHHHFRDTTDQGLRRSTDLPFMRMVVTHITDTTVHYRSDDGMGTNGQFKMDRAAFEREYGGALVRGQAGQR